MKAAIVSIALIALLALPGWANAASLFVLSVGTSQVEVIVIGGTVRTIALGEMTPEGVLLKSIADGVAEFEMEKQTLRLGIGQSTTERVVIQMGNDGRFHVAAQLNGVSVPAIIDISQPNVVIGGTTAKRLGLDYRYGLREIAQTDSENLVSYLITLPRIKVGEITLTNVACHVLENFKVGRDYEMLVGKSFLDRVQAMSRSQLKVKPVAEMIMRPFLFEQKRVEAH